MEKAIMLTFEGTLFLLMVAVSILALSAPMPFCLGAFLPIGGALTIGLIMVDVARN